MIQGDEQRLALENKVVDFRLASLEGLYLREISWGKKYTLILLNDRGFGDNEKKSREIYRQKKRIHRFN